jgi:hypothetical protein
MRTQANSLALAVSEIKDPVTRSMGAQRLVGNALAMGAYPAIAMMMKSIFGIEPEDEEDARQFLPDWQKNSTLMFTSPFKDGKATFQDLSWLSPQQYFIKPLTALMRGGLWEAGKEAGKPFLSEDIFTRKVVDLMRNVDSDRNNRPIYNPNDDLAGQVSAGRDHLWKVLEPGILVHKPSDS